MTPTRRPASAIATYIPGLTDEPTCTTLTSELVVEVVIVLELSVEEEVAEVVEVIVEEFVEVVEEVVEVVKFEVELPEEEEVVGKDVVVVTASNVEQLVEES